MTREPIPVSAEWWKWLIFPGFVLWIPALTALVQFVHHHVGRACRTSPWLAFWLAFLGLAIACEGFGGLLLWLG